MPRLFGTDGIRGVAGVDVTQDLGFEVARAAVQLLTDSSARPLVVVGRDTRPSGPMLAGAVVDGLLTAGADVADLGIVPTPAVAHAIAAGLPGFTRRPAFGVVISASHNPATDNGIKLFGPGGSKLPVHVEEDIEDRIEQPLQGYVPRPGDLLPVDGVHWYAEHLVTASGARLAGLKVVVDCANGAAAGVAPRVYTAAGAEVIAINTNLDGERINDGCGATHLGPLQAAVVDHGATLGVAHDGDADRCLAVDAAGRVVDGDGILAVLAVALAEREALPHRAIAATVMSNQGLVLGLAEHGIEVRRTDVGDRAVLERMLADGLVLGGEQSGHIVLREHATTGDGLLTALSLMARVAATGRSLAHLAAVVQPLPQVLVNVRVGDKRAALAAAGPAGDAVAAELGREGRVLVRPSGTEPLLRVMVEAPTEERARRAAEQIAAAAAAS